MSSNRDKWKHGKFQLDNRKLFPSTLVKYKQVSEGGCEYSKWAPEQPGLSWPCWVMGPPKYPSNPSHSGSLWNHSLGRNFKYCILDTNKNNLDHQFLAYFDLMWECYKSGDSFSFPHFLSVEWHFPNRLKLWTPAIFQLLQVTLKSSPPCQTIWSQNIYAAASITVQILKTPNVSEDSQVTLTKTKIRLLWVHIWDIDSVPSLPAEGIVLRAECKFVS